MSDDDGDFFDTPRGNDSPKKYSWGRSGGSQSTSKQMQGKQSDRDSDRQSPAKQVVVAKIPTGKLQNNAYSDSYSSEDEDRTGRTEKTYKTSERKSRSRSYSNSSGSDRSGSRSTSRSSSRSRSRNSSRSSHSDYDDGKNSKGTSGKMSNSNTQITNSTRPKTGVSRMRARGRQVEESQERPSHNDRKYSDDSSASSSESESDMTDVSPLTSPHRTTPKHSPKKVKIVEDPMRTPKSPMHKDLVSYKARPKSAHGGGYDHLLTGDKDSVNLKVLMQAILEMERDKEDDRHGGKSPQQHFRVPGSYQNAPSIAESNCSRSTSCSISSRKNMSFNNSRARDIDRENQRLMKEIMKFAHPKKKQAKQKKQPMTANRAVTSAALNRKREQERIERDNRTMLKRLESASATKSLQKDHLNQELFSTTYVGVPLGVIHAQKNKAVRPRSAHSVYSERSMSGGSRTRSMSQMASDNYSVISDATSVHSGFTSGSVKSRRSAASPQSKPRPKSAHVMNSGGGGGRPRPRRPAWEEGW